VFRFLYKDLVEDKFGMQYSFIMHHFITQ